MHLSRPLRYATSTESDRSHFQRIPNARWKFHVNRFSPKPLFYETNSNAGAYLNTTILTSSIQIFIFYLSPLSLSSSFPTAHLSFISHTSFIITIFNNNCLPWVSLEPCTGWVLLRKKGSLDITKGSYQIGYFFAANVDKRIVSVAEFSLSSTCYSLVN